MNEFEKLLRKKAGLPTIDVKTDIPENVNKYDKSSLSIASRPEKVENPTDIIISRSGTIPELSRITDLKRPGVTRELGDPEEYKHAENQNQNRLTDLTDYKHYEGSPGDDKNVDPSTRPESTPGNPVDVGVTRTDKLEVPTDQDDYRHAKDQNRNSVRRNSEGVYENIQDVLDEIGRVASQISSVTGIKDYTQINNVIKKFSGGKGVEIVTGFDASNQELLAYFKHQLQNNQNLLRIPLDLAFRYITLPSNYELGPALQRALFTGEGTEGHPVANSLLKLTSSFIKLLGRNPNESLYSGERGVLHSKFTGEWESAMKSSAPNQNLYSDAIKGQGTFKTASEYFGYELQEGKVKEVVKYLDDKLTKYGFNSPERLNKFTSNPGAKDEIYYSTYNNVRGIELPDDAYWGCKVVPFSGVTSLLPEFPEEFSYGWWPITSCSFTKGSLVSKDFEFPYFNLKIPMSGERPSNFKIQLLDNSRRAFRYWLEEYISKCFNVNNNTTLPYKNLCFDIEVYRYDCTLNVLYSKRLICLLSSWNSIFEGAATHSTYELDLDFTIVGEYQ